MARPLNALMAGEQTAVTLGLNARNVRLKVFLIASLMTGMVQLACMVMAMDIRARQDG